MNGQREDLLLSNLDVDNEEGIKVSLSVSSLSYGIYLAAMIHEQGLPVKIDDSIPGYVYLYTECKAKDAARVNFAYYLANKWERSLQNGSVRSGSAEC